MAETAAVATPTPEGGAQPEPRVDAPKTAELAPVDTTIARDGEKAPEKPPEPRFYTRKVNGKEEQIPAEAVDAAARALGLEPNEIMSVAQLKRAAYQKFEEADKIRKQVESLRGIKDPWKLAREMAGLDDGALDKLAEERLIARMQREALDPAQREILEQREALAREKAEIDAQKKAAADAQMTAQAQAVRERLEPMVLDAIDKAGLPKTPDAVRAVANELTRQHRYGLPLDIDAAVRDAQAQFFQPVLATVAKMSPDQLVKALGKDAIDAILRHSLAQRNTPAEPAKQTQPAVPAKQERPYMTPKELEALVEARVRSLK